jgi:hypothetical protein
MIFSKDKNLNVVIIGGISGDLGHAHYEISRIIIPSNASLCSMRYRINTKLDDEDYESSFFDVIIKA